MKTIDEINLELQEAAQEEREILLEAEYQLFVEEMHYLLTCEQWERDMEFYNDSLD